MDAIAARPAPAFRAVGPMVKRTDPWPLLDFQLHSLDRDLNRFHLWTLNSFRARTLAFRTQ